MNAASWYSLLADVVLVIHFAFVVFVVIGLLLIWIGWFFRWSFVRNIWFRMGHLAAMGVVVLESVFGVTCPLTTWENDLHWLAGDGVAYRGSFMQHWIHRIMFFEASSTAFTVAYTLFFLTIVLSFVVVKPTRVSSQKGNSRSE